MHTGRSSTTGRFAAPYHPPHAEAALSLRGAHEHDLRHVERLADVLARLVAERHLIVADERIELGLGGGPAGGRVIDPS